MFLYQLCNKLCRDRRIPFYSSNHHRPNEHIVTPQTASDFCLGPIRLFELKPFETFDHIEVRRIYHVRDPRDVLVSQYFSLGWLHTDQDFNSEECERRSFIRQTNIDDYVLNDEQVLWTLEFQYRQLLNRRFGPRDEVVTYEQMVSNFDDWLAQFIRPFDFGFARLTRLKYGLKYRREFRPDTKGSGHKRRVIPGDYLRQLRPDTIDRLNHRLAPILDGIAKLTDNAKRNTVAGEKAYSRQAC